MGPSGLGFVETITDASNDEYVGRDGSRELCSSRQSFIPSLAAQTIDLPKVQRRYRFATINVISDSALMKPKTYACLSLRLESDE